MVKRTSYEDLHYTVFSSLDSCLLPITCLVTGIVEAVMNCNSGKPALSTVIHLPFRLVAILALCSCFQVSKALTGLEESPAWSELREAIP